MTFALTCRSCGWTGPEATALTACPACGGMLEFVPDTGAGRMPPTTRGRVSDFDPLMPVAEPTAAHPEFDHPYTPLIHARALSALLGITLFIKDETGLPTGSWKDREAYVFFDRLRRHGVSDIVMFSAGNTGAALARAAGILGWSRLHLVSPAGSRRRMLSLPHFENDNVSLVFVEGSNDECIHHAREYARHRGLATEGGFTNYVRREGLKTLGLELIRQAAELGVAFDWYVQPVAGGIGLYSFWKAHVDAGRGSLQPRMLGVQASICQPFVNGWQERSPTLAERHVPAHVTASPYVRVLRTRRPVDSYPCLFDIQARTGGDFVGVNEMQILEGLRLFHQEPYFRDACERRGIVVGLEPATALAGLAGQVRRGAIPAGSTVVLNCSGAAKPGDVDPAWLDAAIDPTPGAAV